MAIYHCSLRSFSREKGHSAVAAAAYRSGENLKDDRTGKSHNYQNRKGVAESFILLPRKVDDTYRNRIILWNAAESSETRKNSRVAREVILALPYELTDNQRLSLTRDMAAYLVEKYRVAVDCAIHTPIEKDGHDSRNHHAHLLFTTRELGREGFGKKTRILDDREQGPVQVELIRDVWEMLANDALKTAGFEARIDKRSLEDQGIDRIPQTHIGNAATHAEDKDDEVSEDEGEEDGDGDTGEEGKSGSGDSGTIAPDLKADDLGKPAKQATEFKRETKPREIDKKGIDQGRSRADFVEEIKKLNKERAAFSTIPLKLQIEKIDTLMDRLDGRLEKLKTISDKTSLPERVKVAILSFFGKAKEAVIVREEIQYKRKLSETEKDVRAERQQSRYGKIYRAGIHEQIREMRENIQILKIKEIEYKKYNSFINLIERRIEQIRIEKGFLPPLPIKPQWVEKTVTIQAAQSKIMGEAKQIKAIIPDENKPAQTQERLSISFKAIQADKPQSGSMSEPEQVSIKEAAVRPEMGVAAPQSKELLVGKVALKAIALSSNPKDYKIPASESMQPLIDRIHKEIWAARKTDAEALIKKSGLAEAFNNPRPKPKQTTTEDVLNKIRREAEQARQNIPPEYRASPYTETHSEPRPSPTNSFKEAWQKADPETVYDQNTQPNNETGAMGGVAEPPKTRMSDVFNSKARIDSAGEGRDSDYKDEPAFVP